MTPETRAARDRFAAFVNALGPEGRYSDLEPDGVARIQDAAGASTNYAATTCARSWPRSTNCPRT